MSNYVFYELRREGGVATVSFTDRATIPPGPIAAEPHFEFAELLSALAFDKTVRVVVLRGHHDGQFLTPVRPPPERETGPPSLSASRVWRVSSGIVHAHLALAMLDKPVVARVGGDAINVGCSYLLASDIIVADETARVADNHLGMGEVEPWGWRMGTVPGDGGAALAPLHFGPTLAKEFLMVARIYDARTLANMGVINWAVPFDQLDAKLDEVVQGLLRRPAYALAWTKRMANKRLVQQLNRTLDPAIGYQLVNLLQFIAEPTAPFDFESGVL